MAPRRNRPSRSTADPAPRDPALYELVRQSMEQAKAAADMAQQVAGKSLDALGKIHTAIESMSSDTAGGGGMPFFAGAGFSGGYGGGPNGGRAILRDDQTRRPRVGPGGYPGGYGYGMQGQQMFGGFGGSGWQQGGMGGILGAAQVGVARLVHGAYGAGQGGAVDYQRQADGSYTSFDRNGAIVEESISPAVAQHRAQVSARAQMAGGSGSLLGAIKNIPVAGKIVGGALIGAEAFQKLGTFVGNQRAANAQYQSIYGPNTDGFTQRLQNLGGRFTNMMSNVGSAFGIGNGGLSDSDYDKAFKGVSAMGFQGGDRDTMMGFARSNFNSMGMGVDDSLQLIGVNAKEASTNLATLSTQLKNVSTMAEAAGQSAEVFRQSFIQSYGTAVGAGFGSSSGAIATAQVSSTVGQGRLFSGLNTSAMYGSVGAQQILAEREGYGSVLDFDLAGQSNPMVIANAQQKQLNQVLDSVVPPDVRKMVEVSISKHGGANNIANDQNHALIVVNDVENQRQGSLNSIAIMQALRTAGIAGAENLDPTAAAIYYVQWVAKQGRNFTDPVARAMAANDQQVGSKQAQQVQKLNKFFGSSPNLGSTTVNGKAVYDPVIAAMQKSDVNYVQVQTASGAEVVSLASAAKDYRDQLTNGTAVIASGSMAGQTVGQSFGKEQSEKYKDTTSAKAKDSVFDAKTWKTLKGLGLTDAELSSLAGLKGTGGMLGSDKTITSIAQKMAAANSKSAGGTISVGLQPNAAKYLQLTMTGDNLVDTAASSGAPPSIPASGSSTGH